MHVKHIDEVAFDEHDGNFASILIPKEMTEGYLVQLIKVMPHSKMPVHLHDHHQAYVILDGSACLRVGDEAREVSAGHVVFLPAHVEHETVQAGPDGMRYIVIE